MRHCLWLRKLVWCLLVSLWKIHFDLEVCAKMPCSSNGVVWWSSLFLTVLFELGICYVFDGQLSEGEGFLREALALRQQIPENVGDITLSKSCVMDSMCRDRVRDGEHLNWLSVRVGLALLGDCLRLQKKVSQAVDVLQQALQLEKNPHTARGERVCGCDCFSHLHVGHSSICVWSVMS